MPAGVYLKVCNGILKNDIPFLSLSPCHFKILKDKAVERNGLDVLERHKLRKKKNMLLTTGSSTYIDVADWSTHDKVVAGFSCESSCKEDEEAAPHSDELKGVESLVKAWVLAQFDAIASNAGEKVNSVVLGNETILHFEVKGHKFEIEEKLQESSDGSLENKKKNAEQPVEILYVLKFSNESQLAGNAYELVFDERNKGNDKIGGVESIGKLKVVGPKMADPVTFNSVRERMSEKDINSDVSTLSWMGTIASDVLNSRYSYYLVELFSILTPLYVHRFL